MEPVSSVTSSDNQDSAVKRVEFRDNMPLNEQVDILAQFLMRHFPARIVNGGAIETAIQILENTVIQCILCGKEAENKKLTIKEAIRINAIGGRCFECVQKSSNCSADETRLSAESNATPNENGDTL